MPSFSTMSRGPSANAARCIGRGGAGGDREQVPAQN
jgi:hypothetical protein